MREGLAYLNEMGNGVSRIVEQWKDAYLTEAKPHDKANPPGQDYENYSRPIIVPT